MATESETQARVRLDPSWREPLMSAFERESMQALRAFLLAEAKAGKRIYPPAAQIFRALDLTPLPAVKVVIIGQDPYHGPGQAEGLCFSVPPGVSKPPSLVNILREVADDMGQTGEAKQFASDGGSLVPWAEQGVLLLNAVLTVEHRRAASHRGQGWEAFTDRVV
ncbi:MAG: uracil-DNA glycosylase, partial [Gammaproteobacteria bacterium]|nr:uracil-DNA glycosylase [Gammaproteobacteria bacterium]